MKQHPDLIQRIPKIITVVRAYVTEAQLRGWFQEVEDFLKFDNLLEVLSDPQHIFNLAKSAFQLCPKFAKVFGPHGEKNIYEKRM